MAERIEYSDSHLALPILKKKRTEVPKVDIKKASLLGIPGELRNRIYRLVLLDELKIDMSPQGCQQPSILRACRQTRQEALSIWLHENSFCLNIISCKPIVPDFDSGHWLRTRTYKWQTSWSGQPDWDNLKAWMKKWLTGKLGRIAQRSWYEDGPEWLKVAIAALDLAEKMHDAGMSWNEIEECIECYKYGIQAAKNDNSNAWK